MKKKGFRFVFVVFILPLFISPLKASEDGLKIGILPSAHEEILKEIFKAASISSKEFKKTDIVLFSSPKKGEAALQENDVQVVALDFFDGSFSLANRPGWVSHKSSAPRKGEIVFIASAKFAQSHPQTWHALATLNKQLNPLVLNHLLALLKEDKKPLKEVAAIFIDSLNWSRLDEQKPAEYEVKPHFPFNPQKSSARFMGRLIKQQFILVFGPLILALLIGSALAPFFYERQLMRDIAQGFSGVFLTIPPIVILCLFIPSLGFGITPVLAGLLIHNILAIAQAGMDSAPKGKLFGFKNFKNPKMVAQLKDMALFNLAVSLLGGFMDAGGVGEVIALGLSLKDVPMILKGTLAALALSMAIKWTFEGLENLLEKKEEN